jgi:hypothetical protein
MHTARERQHYIFHHKQNPRSLFVDCSKNGFVGMYKSSMPLAVAM